MKTTITTYYHNNLHRFNLLLIAVLFSMVTTAAAQEHEMRMVQQPRFEVETQLPCFIAGGYHASFGVRYGAFRMRAEVQNSGTVNFGQFALAGKTSDYKRYVDDVSAGVNIDYYISSRLFVSGSVYSRNWNIHHDASGAEKQLRTLDFAIGAGYQYYVYNNWYVQAAFGATFRKEKTISFANTKYTIGSTDILPMLRVGYQF